MFAFTFTLTFNFGVLCPINRPQKLKIVAFNSLPSSLNVTCKCMNVSVMCKCMHVGDYGNGATGVDGGGQLVGLHVNCRHHKSGQECTICQASEGDAMATADTYAVTSSETGDGGMFVEVLQGLLKSNEQTHGMHQYLTDGNSTMSDESE